MTEFGYLHIYFVHNKATATVLLNCQFVGTVVFFLHVQDIGYHILEIERMLKIPQDIQ